MKLSKELVKISLKLLNDLATVQMISLAINDVNEPFWAILFPGIGSLINVYEP